MGVGYMNRVKNSLKAVVRPPSLLVHRTADRLCPALKCYFVRTVHRHVGLSNLLRKMVGKPPLDGPRHEERSPLFACLAADCRLNVRRAVKVGINTAKRHPALYGRVKGLLQRFPGLSNRIRKAYHQVPSPAEPVSLPAPPGEGPTLPRQLDTSYEETLFLQLKAFMRDGRK